MPKSTSSGRPVPASIRMLSGFTSRCTRPCSCACWRASRIGSTMAGAHGRPTSGPSARSSSATVRPSQIGHGVEHQALPLAHEVDRQGVGMVEPGDGAGLLLEPGERRRRSRAGRSGGPSPPAGAGDPCPRTSNTSAKPPASDQPDHAVTADRARGRGGRASRVSLARRGSRPADLGAEAAPGCPARTGDNEGCPRRSGAWQDEQTSSVRAPPETNHPRASED